MLCDKTHTRYKKAQRVTCSLHLNIKRKQNHKMQPVLLLTICSIWFNILGNFQIKNDETVLCSHYPGHVIQMQSLLCFVLLGLAFQLLFSVFSPLKQKKKSEQKIPKQLPILLVGLIMKYTTFDGFCIKNTWNMPFQCFSSQFWNLT